MPRGSGRDAKRRAAPRPNLELHPSTHRLGGVVHHEEDINVDRVGLRPHLKSSVSSLVVQDVSLFTQPDWYLQLATRTSSSLSS
jgi:hypothetical protein